MVQGMIDAGMLTEAEAIGHPDANKITRALGMRPEVEVEVRPEPMEMFPGDIFLQSSALALAVSCLGVLIFAGLTAYDTQRLKNEYAVLRGTEFAGKAIVLGALTLYLDFINMFTFLLNFMGNRD